MNVSPYGFRLAKRSDLPLLRKWLRTPEVVRWWGDPLEQEKLIRGDLDDPRMVTRIVEFEKTPFAYVQDYDVSSWPQPQFTGLPAKTRAIDAFIGEPLMSGLGHGSRFLKLLAETLRNGGTTLVVIDPDVNNLRARRAYERAGFRTRSILETEEGLCALMIFDS